MLKADGQLPVAMSQIMTHLMPFRDDSCSCTRDASSSSKSPCCSILCDRFGLVATYGVEVLLFLFV